MEKQKPYVFDFNDREWTQVREKVKVKVFQGADGSTITLNELSPGHTPNPHSHSYEQTVYCLKGSTDFYIDGVAHPIKEGCCLAIPPFAEHYSLNRGSEPVVDMEIFTPKRSDRTESALSRPAVVAGLPKG
jgi:quercetin dioxygenase-like cupin family protein